MLDYFQTQAYDAAFNIDLNIFSDAWPIISLVDKLFGYIDTKMAYQEAVMMSINELCLNDFRYKQ